VRSYLAHLTDLGLKASSVHDYARPVKTWLRFLYAENIIPDNPTARVKLPRIADDILPAFAADDVRKLLEACQDSQDSERDTALVLCLLDTGYRAAEFVALTVGDVDPKAGAVTVRSGKGNKGRTVYIGARARRALARYLLRRTLSANDPLFPLLNIDCF
jgi:site-specific recombinase XerD